MVRRADAGGSGLITGLRLDEAMTRLSSFPALVFFLLSFPVKATTQSTDWHTATMGNYVEIDRFQHGFLRFRGTVDGKPIFALSNDIGSAGPEEDLSLYVSNVSGVTRVLLLPEFKHRLFLLHEDQGKLIVQLSEGSRGNSLTKPEAEPLMEIDLRQLMETY